MSESLNKLKALTESLLIKDRQTQYAEEIYRGVFNTIPLPIIVIAVDDFKLVDANKYATDKFGYTYDEIMLFDAWTKSLNPTYTKHVISNHIPEAQGSFIHKNGHIVKTQSTLKFFWLGRKEYCIVILNAIELTGIEVDNGRE